MRRPGRNEDCAMLAVRLAIEPWSTNGIVISGQGGASCSPRRVQSTDWGARGAGQEAQLGPSRTAFTVRN